MSTWRAYHDLICWQSWATIKIVDRQTGNITISKTADDRKNQPHRKWATEYHASWQLFYKTVFLLYSLVDEKRGEKCFFELLSISSRFSLPSSNLWSDLWLSAMNDLF